MYDQIGGGFHRYSVDAQWLVPHFEKMLYDNGQLASTYARAFELTNDAFQAEIVRETLDYVLREMTSKDGAFFSAQDAEVHSREGDNYLWTADQVRATLSAAGFGDDVEFAMKVYGLDRGTNFQDPHHPDLPPRNVLHQVARPDDLARQLKIPREQFEAKVIGINAVLIAERDKRDQPRLDDKIIAGWNGLMIAGFADGGRVLKESRFVESAKRAASFVFEHMQTTESGLLRTHRAGVSKIDAFLEDYALMIRGLLALHRATNESKWLDAAERLADAAKTQFWDSSLGVRGYFDTLEGQADLFVRVKSSYDGAVPSGNTVMLLNLIDLHETTKKSAYLDDALATLRSLSSVIAQRPAASVLSVQGLKRFIDRYPGPLTALARDGAATSAADIVEFSVDRTVLRLAPGQSVRLNLTIHIAEDYHINAHEPGDASLIPLRIDLIDGDGIHITVKYPPGEALRGPIADSSIQVHAGQATIPIRLEKSGSITGKPRIVVTYQACTDKACLEPKTVVLDGLAIVE
jgi:uncharacterized protein YyaL (SSP411 family)